MNTALSSVGTTKTSSKVSWPWQAPNRVAHWLTDSSENATNQVRICKLVIHPSTPPNPTFHRQGSLTSQDPQASSGCGCAMAVPWLCHGEPWANLGAKR